MEHGPRADILEPILVLSVVLEVDEDLASSASATPIIESIARSDGSCVQPICNRKTPMSKPVDAPAAEADASPPIEEDETLLYKFGLAIGRRPFVALAAAAVVCAALVSGLFTAARADVDLFDSLILRPGSRLERESDNAHRAFEDLTACKASPPLLVLSGHAASLIPY